MEGAAIDRDGLRMDYRWRNETQNRRSQMLTSAAQLTNRDGAWILDRGFLSLEINCHGGESLVRQITLLSSPQVAKCTQSSS